MTTDEPNPGGLERLSRDECIAALRANRLGRVVTTFGPDHRPLVRPVSYVCDPRSAAIICSCCGELSIRAPLRAWLHPFRHSPTATRRPTVKDRFIVETALKTNTRQ